jgi:hypothetical protein
MMQYEWLWVHSKLLIIDGDINVLDEDNLPSEILVVLIGAGEHSSLSLKKSKAYSGVFDPPAHSAFAPLYTGWSAHSAGCSLLPKQNRGTRPTECIIGLLRPWQMQAHLAI